MFHKSRYLMLLCLFAAPLMAVVDIDADDQNDEPNSDIESAELVISFEDEKIIDDEQHDCDSQDDQSTRAPRLSRNAIFYTIASGNLEAMRLVLDRDPEALNRFFVFNETEQSFDGFHRAPTNGDTPLIYLVKTIIELQKAFESRTFSDEHTIQVAFEHRFNMVSELVFHPKIVASAENGQGHTAASMAAQAGMSRLANMIGNASHVMPKQQQSEGWKYKARLAKLDVSPEVRKRINEEIDALAQKHPAEKGTHINFINALLDLPWNTAADTTLTISAVAAALESEHYALKKVKDAVLDYLAVTSLTKSQGKGKILCLVGPPGTGKTSIVQSIARGLNRPMARTGLGGAHGESVIRGWNKTYISAAPGEILKGLIQTKVKNPVFLLDEIDKISDGHYNGNPVSALLEALDPEQNHSFVDRFIEIPFDLSQVFFIATANNRNDIPQPLLDRLEIIEVPGYSLEDKVEIATKYLIPRVASEIGELAEDTQRDYPDFTFALSQDVIRAIITNYTFEAGVRKLTQHLKTIFAKTARHYLDKRTVPNVTIENLPEYLGPSNHLPRVSQKAAVGVVNCLSVYPGIGGATSFLEVILVPNGKGDLKVSKVLENDSENSVGIALAYVRAHAQEWGIQASQFSSNDIHVHKPGIGHVDGPSAGIANVTAMVSAFTNRLCDPSYAMTGELSLTGKVMAIGGLKEKILAAKREGITKVIIPSENEPELSEFKQLLDGIEVIPVSDVREVLNRVLLPAARKR